MLLCAHSVRVELLPDEEKLGRRLNPLLLQLERDCDEYSDDEHGQSHERETRHHHSVGQKHGVFLLCRLVPGPLAARNVDSLESNRPTVHHTVTTIAHEES